MDDPTRRGDPLRRQRRSPGSLAGLLAHIQALQANVVDVEHHRDDAGLGVDEVEIILHVETRGADHCAELVQELTDLGYRVSHRTPSAS